MNFLQLSLCFLVLLVFELLYFKIAIKYQIIDYPNHRSSHENVTIRGGGVIFSVALLLLPILTEYMFGYFLAGLLLISAISIIDDIKSQSNTIRTIVHFLAVALMFCEFNVYEVPLYVVAISFIAVVGVINAVNFMDGINGLTGGYALVTMLTLWYINQQITTFTSANYLVLVIIALLVFIFFNFRTKAKCFAGDAGSVSIAFIIIFFILQLIIKTKNINFLLILLLYGLDTATTILFRIIRGENIFEAHRGHFYQFLVHKKKVPHLIVASVYMLLQGIGNVIVLTFQTQKTYGVIAIIAIITLAFILIRVIVEDPFNTNKSHLT